VSVKPSVGSGNCDNDHVFLSLLLGG
jgi:hypothetical protein